MTKQIDERNFCRVCGLDQEEPVWGESDQCPTFEICLCCGTEFGYDDYTLEGIRKRRENWLLNPQKWLDPTAKPIGWDLEAQLKQIPKKYL